MALFSDRTRNATIRARNATNVLIIPKADFNKLRRSVPAFGDVFSELVKRRSVAGAPYSSVEPSMLASCCGHPIPIPAPESELGPPPGMPTGGWGGDSGQGGDLPALGRVSDDWRSRRCAPGETPGCAPSGGS